MQVREIMTANPACCTPDSSLREIAQMMVEHDCGCIPVVENLQNKKPVGTVTDRDITIRAFATGQNPATMKASDVMTTGVTTITPETSIQECCDVMEDKKIRRVLVIDETGRCSGIVAQADVAEYGPNPSLISDMVHEISESAPSPNRGGFDRRNNNQFYSNNRSFQTNRSFSTPPPLPPIKPRYSPPNRSFSENRTYSTKESIFSLGSLLPLLAGIGIAAGAKYYFDSSRETGHRAVYRRQPEKIHVDFKDSSGKSHSDLSRNTENLSAETRDTISGYVSSSKPEDDLTFDIEKSRTAGQG